jgi:hypothetical protein
MPLLQRDLEDRGSKGRVIRDRRFRDAGVARFCVAKYPTATSKTEIADSSFINELERSGSIDRLSAADRVHSRQRIIFVKFVK